ncbi:MAG: Flp family type IVb pilin [Planctomycetaceae bacterium]|jgi:Flp pilus assembly pilin Flp
MIVTRIRRTLQRLHRDESGGPSLETILILGAIAIPILIFFMKFGWPKVRNYFDTGLQNLQGTTDKTIDGQ